MTVSATPLYALQVHDTRPEDVDSLLSRWLLVQHAVQRVASSSTPAQAATVLTRALVDLETADLGQDDPHLVAQRAVLTDLLEILTRDGGPSPRPATTTADDEPGDVPAGDALAGAGAGDVVCVLRLVGGDGQESDMRELLRQAKASVRSSDHVSVLDERDLVVVLDSVPVPVAWRRMKALVGEAPLRAGEATPRAVWAGIARVGRTGPDVALAAAYTAVAQAVEANDTVAPRGWVALAVDPALSEMFDSPALK